MMTVDSGLLFRASLYMFREDFCIVHVSLSTLLGLYYI